jgi:hypothetical protein
MQQLHLELPMLPVPLSTTSRGHLDFADSPSPPIAPAPPVAAVDLRWAIASGLRWLAGATLLRIGVEATLLQAPLWSWSGAMGLGLLLAPAGIGLYLSHCYPTLRLRVAYHLMFIMVGLLLGGRI